MSKDDDWFERLYRRYYSSVVAYFVKKGFPVEEARELAQDVFLRVYRRMETFRGEASERTWLFRIAHNLWANELRSINTDMRKGHTVSLDGDPGSESTAALVESIAGTDPLPDAILEHKDLLERLVEAIQQLPTRQRSVLLLQNQGLSYKEIATILGIKVETVKSLRHDALEKLRRQMGARLPLDGPDDDGGAR